MLSGRESKGMGIRDDESPTARRNDVIVGSWSGKMAKLGAFGDEVVGENTRQ